MTQQLLSLFLEEGDDDRSSPPPESQQPPKQELFFCLRCLATKFISRTISAKTVFTFCAIFAEHSTNGQPQNSAKCRPSSVFTCRCTDKSHLLPTRRIGTRSVPLTLWICSFIDLMSWKNGATKFGISFRSNFEKHQFYQIYWKNLELRNFIKFNATQLINW